MDETEPRPQLERFPFTYNGVMREVYRTPAPSDRAVVVMHELGGLSQETCELAEYLADDFQVYLPLMFGRVGQRNWLRGMVPGGMQGFCVRSEFLALQAQRSSPIAEWMRGLCRHVAAAHEGTPVGIVGMCLTGAMVFSMAWDPNIGAAVSAQPAMPVMRLPGEITVSDADMQATRTCLRNGTPIVALRFAADSLSPEPRLDGVAESMGDLAGAAPEADQPGAKKPLTMVTYERTVDEGIQHATLTANADDTRDPTFERSRNRVRHFLLEALRS